MTTDLVKQLRQLSAENPGPRDCIDDADDMGMPAPIKEEKRCIWCEALEGDHSAPVCSGPDGRGHHFRKTPWVTPNG